MPGPSQIKRYFSKPVIPVLGDVSQSAGALADASSVILQGVSITDLPKTVEVFRYSPLDHLGLFVHIDLVSGLENNEAGLAYLAELGRVDGVVTVHHYLAQAARKLGLLSVVRVFVSDSRALQRGLKVVAKSRPDVFEILPAAAATKVAEDLRTCAIPHIAGGLCRTESDVHEALASGSLAVTSTCPDLWKMNRK